jgi:hypothetical protein
MRIVDREEQRLSEISDNLYAGRRQPNNTAM